MTRIVTYRQYKRIHDLFFQISNLMIFAMKFAILLALFTCNVADDLFMLIGIIIISFTILPTHALEMLRDWVWEMANEDIIIEDPHKLDD